ncbi:MAG: ribonuclease III [Candidatus Dojkabacteria bacterium]
MKRVRKMNNIEGLEKNLNIKFKNKELLNTALTHRSFINENREVKEHNERLEFLGDAVLELIVSVFLFDKYRDRAEGELTSFRAALVKTDSLAEVAKGLGIGTYMNMSKGEEESGGREKDYLLANTYEAILGAIYLDSGYESCTKFVHKTLLHKIEDIVEKRLDIDSKTKIQELVQSIYKSTPTYEVVKEIGPDHSKEFTVVVKIDNKVIGHGTGSSKQRAEEQAAKEGIEYIEKSNK